MIDQKLEGPNLAALVASKICHDIFSPITGVVPGLDMLKESDVAKKEPDALGLIDDGVQKVWAKLDFYRFAIGGAVTEGEGSLEDARAILEKLYRHVKAELQWSAPAISAPHAAVRVIANLVYIAGDCLPRGGTVEVTAAPGEVRITGTGRVSIKKEVAGGLRGEPPEGGHQGAFTLPLLAHIFATRAGLAIELKETPEKVELFARSAQIGRTSAAA
ncbi:MAG: hypothetical protein JNJ73_03165 [Hyphomonadaceae bacterium]|nr:hypothetical protein [Hyphomonadaceae bacterium]